MGKIQGGNHKKLGHQVTPHQRMLSYFFDGFESDRTASLPSF
jgi:hypothetical protein